MRVIDDKTRIPETLSKPGRLNFGFTFEDILSILKMKIGISDPEILSTVIDYFGDRGVVTPIILKYPTNYWVNAYRFGENLHGYPEQKRAYFVRAALERLFNNLKIRDISQFDFEKFIVFLIQAFQKFDWKEVKEFNWGKAFDEFGARPITDGFRSLLMKDGQALTEKRYLFKESQDNKVIKVINNRITLNEAFYTIRPPESNPLSTVIPKIYLYTDLWTELVYNQQIWPRKDELMLLLTTCDNKYNFLNSYMVGLYSWFYHDYSRFSKVLAETKIILDLRDKNPEECATKIDEIDKSLIHEIATRLIQCENKRELWEKRNEIIRKLDKELTEKTFIGPLWNEVKNKLIDLSPFNEDEQFVFNYLQTFYNICRASINILRSVLKEREKGESEKYMQQYNTAVEDAKFIPGLLKVSKNDLGEVTKVLEHNFPILLQFFEKSVKKGKYQTVNLMDEIKDAYLRRAIDLAKLCESENGKIRPKVGAIIVKNGEIIAEAYRNQDGKGSHAEAIAIKQCRGEDLEGAILVTTMEPCTEGDCRLEDVRLPCAALIAHYNIKGVVYGMLDPNKSIRGEGINFLRHVYKIPVIQFPDSLVKEIEDLNSGYISSVYKEQGTPKPKF
jgi:pyrimidine deaminase RibD-like protein